MPSKEEIDAAVNHFIEHRDIESAIVIVKTVLSGYIIVGGSRKNITKDAISIILTDYEQLEAEKREVIAKLENDIKDNNFKETECLEDKGRYYYAKEILEMLKEEKKYESND